LEEMQESIDQRGNWIHEIDHFLFGNQDWIPVIMPEIITMKQKALKKSSPKKSKKLKVAEEEDDDDEEDEDKGNSPMQKIQSPTRKGAGKKITDSLYLQAVEKMRIEQLTSFYRVSPEDQDKKVYNTVQRIQELMYLETNHLNKPELVK